MMGRLLGRLGILGPHDVASLDDMRSGPVRVSGTLTCASPIESPVNGTRCAGFLYHASHLGWRTVGPASRKTLMSALVYAPSLSLSLADGSNIPLAPKTADTFAAEGHRKLAELDHPGFRAKETLLMVDDAVTVTGRAKRRDETWTIVFDQIITKR